MALKWIKLVSTFGIFFLCFLTHFIYEWFPNTLFSIFFPVNESIWEHMKMLFTAVILYSIIDYLILRSFKQKTDNFLINVFITATTSIPIFLILYLLFNWRKHGSKFNCFIYYYSY